LEKQNGLALRKGKAGEKRKKTAHNEGRILRPLAGEGKCILASRAIACADKIRERGNPGSAGHQPRF
jgi:hypothetical protein